MKAKTSVKTTVLCHYRTHDKVVKVVRTDTKNRSKVQAHVFVNGEKVEESVTFSFKKLHQTFASPYISWANQACSEIWPQDEKYTLNAVQDGKRLYSSIPQYAPSMQEKLQIVEEAKAISEQLCDGVFCGCEPVYPIATDRDYVHLFICRTGKISSYYDLDAVFAFYKRLGVELSDDEKQEVHRLCEYDILDFGQHKPYLYAASKTTPELIVSGLLLGFPLEMTSYIILHTTRDEHGIINYTEP